MSLEIIYLIHMYKKDLVLNNQQWLICHQTKWSYQTLAPIFCPDRIFISAPAVTFQQLSFRCYKAVEVPVV